MASRSFDGQVRLKPDATPYVVSAFRRSTPLALVVIAVAALAAQTPERSRAETLAKRAGDRLAALQREADRLASEERTLLTDLRRLEIDRQLKAEQVKQIDVDAAKVQTDLDATKQKMAALEATEASARPELRARLVEIYKLGRA